MERLGFSLVVDPKHPAMIQVLRLAGQRKESEMEALFTRTGKEVKGDIEGDSRPYIMVPKACNRCHVIDGQRLWIMGTVNGRPYSHTGFDCWTCGNSGVRGFRKERLFTAQQLARLNKSAETRAANRAAKFKAEQEKAAEQRRVSEAHYRADHAEFLELIATLCTGNGSDFWDRMAADLLVALRSPSERQIELVKGEIAKRAANASSEFVGVVGDKVTLSLKIERIISLDGAYGRSYMTIARTDDGSVVVYRGNVDLGQKGEQVKIMATIKEHTYYQGVKQTIINRPKKV